MRGRWPQDVTSSAHDAEGSICSKRSNLTRPKDRPATPEMEVTPTRSWGELNIQPDRGGKSRFRRSTALRPRRLLSVALATTMGKPWHACFSSGWRVAWLLAVRYRRSVLRVRTDLYRRRCRRRGPWHVRRDGTLLLAPRPDASNTHRSVRHAVALVYSGCAGWSCAVLACANSVSNRNGRPLRRLALSTHIG
jgi:hypothetical protein